MTLILPIGCGNKNHQQPTPKVRTVQGGSLSFHEMGLSFFQISGLVRMQQVKVEMAMETQ